MKFFQQTREEFERGDGSECVAWTGFEEILRCVLPDLQSLFGR
jgi:hypothetical protein